MHFVPNLNMNSNGIEEKYNVNLVVISVDSDSAFASLIVTYVSCILAFIFS